VNNNLKGIQISKIAKEVNKQSSEILKYLKGIGIEVGGVMSKVNEKVYRKVLSHFGGLHEETIRRNQILAKLRNIHRGLEVSEIEEEVNKVTPTDNYSNLFKFDSTKPYLSLYNNKVLALGVYHPYGNGYNPEFSDFERSILGFKDKRQKCINSFATEVKKILLDLNRKVFILPIPPSNKTSMKFNYANRKLCYHVSDGEKIISLSYLINRTKDVPPSHDGNRNIQKHLESIEISDLNCKIDDCIIIFDDVITSGTSFEAVRQLLNVKGYMNIKGIVLGATYSKYKKLINRD